MTESRPPRRTDRDHRKRPNQRGPGGARRSERRLPPAPAGLRARQAAAEIVRLVFEQRRPLEDAMSRAFASAHATHGGEDIARDRAFARAMAMEVLRRHGQLTAVLETFLERGWPKSSGSLRPILLVATAQLVFMDVPAHAVIHLAIEQCRLDGRARRFDKLANAVLRRVSEHGKAIADAQDAVALNVPAWLQTRWQAAYGPDLARAIATASLAEPPLDLAVKAPLADGSETTGEGLPDDGTLLATGALRLSDAGRIEDIPGYRDGTWWVQDAAAQLPARLLGEVAGLDVVDLCAAPGGKTAQLAAAGARVTAVDSSTPRLAVLTANLTRLHLTAETVDADLLAWQPQRNFDAVLLDAPCSATGTIRRHPDLMHLKGPDDIARTAELQARLLDAALALVKPGGRIVYCVCSLEPEEGPAQIARALASHAGLSRLPISPGECGIDSEWLTGDGDLRTLPSHLADQGGMDGFFAARLRRAD